MCEESFALPLGQLVVMSAVTDGPEELIEHTQTLLLESEADPLT